MTIKTVLDTPILSESGALTEESEKISIQVEDQVKLYQESFESQTVSKWAYNTPTEKGFGSAS